MFQVVSRHNGPEFYTFKDVVIVGEREGEEDNRPPQVQKLGLADMQICVLSAKLKNGFCS